MLLVFLQFAEFDFVHTATALVFKISFILEGKKMPVVANFKKNQNSVVALILNLIIIKKKQHQRR